MTMEHIEQKHEECLKLYVENFQYDVTKLRGIAKERRVLFIEQVKKVEESIKSEMSKEVEKVEHNYSSLHSKVDIIANTIKKLVEYYTLFSTKLDAKT